MGSTFFDPVHFIGSVIGQSPGLEWHPRFNVHFISTISSWLNMVGRFFRDLTENRLRRGEFRSVLELIQALDDFVNKHNESPKPFIWTSSSKDILAKVMRKQASGTSGNKRDKRAGQAGTA